MSGFRFNSNFASVKKAVHRGAERGLGKALEHNLQVSNSRVPIEEGTLERSGNISQEDLVGSVSYDTPYATKQHEDLGLAHDAGREAKYLEKTLNGERSTSLKIIGDEIRGEAGL